LFKGIIISEKSALDTTRIETSHADFSSMYL
jgi:hypothetical protein